MRRINSAITAITKTGEIAPSPYPLLIMKAMDVAKVISTDANQSRRKRTRKTNQTMT